MWIFIVLIFNLYKIFESRVYYVILTRSPRFQVITIEDDYQKADPRSNLACLHDSVIIAWLLLLLISLIEVLWLEPF